MSLYIGNSKVTGVQRVNGIPVWGDIEGNLSDQEDLQEALNEKQDTLVSGTNIKTINGEDILGEGDIEVQGGGASFVIGQIIQSTIPLTDAGLHLLDGSLIYHGAYSDFIDYMANYYNEAPEYSNVNIVGSLTDNNGVLSGFSTSNYSSLPINFNPNSYSWEFQIKFTTNDDITTTQFVYNEYYTLQIYIYNNNLRISLGTGVNAWDILNSSVDIMEVTSNTEYIVKIVFDGSKYDILVNNENVYSVESSVIIGVQTGYIGVSNTIVNPFLGLIDLNEFYININGSRWWTGRYPIGFTNEAQWQAEIANYGVCGKFVYDSTNSTIRLPKYSNKIYSSAIDSTAPVVGNGSPLGLTNGSVSGSLGIYDGAVSGVTIKQAAIVSGSTVGGSISSTYSISTSQGVVGVTTDGTKSGIVANLTNITASLEGYYYIVIATVTKTSIQVDIDEIMTDLSNKANKDLSNVSWNNVSSSDIPTDVELLSGSGTLTLEDNKLYKLTSSGSTTFSLPTITDTTKFHQIMVQLKMSSVVTINVGTSYYFNRKAPDLSKAGSYDLVWEYDNIDGHWVFGATSKGTA